MPLVGRHPLSFAIVAVSLALTAGVFLFALPVYHAQQGETIRLPHNAPAVAAPGAQGWSWSAGTPGWRPGQMFGRHHDYNASGVQPIEVAAAQLTAAHALLDANSVRVLTSLRANTSGSLAVLAAASVDQAERTCLAVQLPGDAPVHWQCPGATPSRTDLEHARVLVGAVSYKTPGVAHAPLYVVGVARGDVSRVVLVAPGLDARPIYDRGDGWGEFSAAITPTGAGARLLVYSGRKLVQVLPLRVVPGTPRVFG